MLEPYARQVEQQRRLDRLPFSNGNDFGAGVADAVGNVVAQEGQRQIAQKSIETQRNRDEQATQAMADFAVLQEKFDLEEIDQRLNAGPGASGYRETIEKSLTTAKTDFLATIKDEELRKKYDARFAEWGGRKVVSAKAFESGEFVNLVKTNVATAIDTKANQLGRATATLEDYDAAITELRGGVFDVEGVPADVRSGLEKEGVAKLSYSFISSRPPEQAKAFLSSGAFDGLLPPEYVQQLDSAADSDIRRLQLEADARARVEKADAKETLDQLIRELGDNVPKSDEEISAAQAMAAKYGFDKEGYDLGKSRVQGMLNREYQNATPAQIDAALKNYDSKIAKAGDKASGADVVARDHLTAILGARSRDVANDPLSAGAKMGIDIQPVDWNDQASIAARRRGADASAKALGVAPVYLSNEEATQLRGQLGTPAGMLAVSSQLNQLGGVAGRRAAQQVSPQNDWFQSSINLAPHIRAAVYNGDKILGSKLVKISANEATPLWREYAAPAMRLMPTDAKGAVYQMALRIYASDAERMGHEEFDEDTFKLAIHAAVGGVTTTNGRKKGGVGEWRNQPILLPPSLNQSQFDTVFSRLNFGKVEGPQYGNGQKISAQSLRDNFTPIAAPSGHFRFQNERGEYAVDAKGRPYQFDFEATARAMGVK